MPVFCQLAYTEIVRWRSYFDKERTFLAGTIEQSIDDLFDGLERRFEPSLVRHAFSYVTASKSGLSEAELEDVLSLDDTVLEDVFGSVIPELRRFPGMLWLKVRAELAGCIKEIEADGAKVFVWAHKQFTGGREHGLAGLKAQRLFLRVEF